MTLQPIPKSEAGRGCSPTSRQRSSSTPSRCIASTSSSRASDYEVSRSTLAMWMVRLGELLQPLINLLREEPLARPYLLLDETTVQVLDEPGKAPETKSYLWAQMSPEAAAPIVLFDDDLTRAQPVSTRGRDPAVRVEYTFMETPADRTTRDSATRFENRPVTPVCARSDIGIVRDGAGSGLARRGRDTRRGDSTRASISRRDRAPPHRSIVPVAAPGRLPIRRVRAR